MEKDQVDIDKVSKEKKKLVPGSTSISVDGNVSKIFVNAANKSKMVYVPAGTFYYGSQIDDRLTRDNESPQTLIGQTAFYIDIFNVTNDQYCEFLNNKMPDKDKLKLWISLKGGFRSGMLRKERCRIRKKMSGTYKVEKGYERHPMVYVSWIGANEYAKWVGSRLPTEQEWEKAARGVDGRLYPWGDEFNWKLCNSREDGKRGTTEVGKYPEGKSYYGCYDMAGNVWEWTDSWYNDTKRHRVTRGGSWFFDHSYCRCADRNGIAPDDWIFNTGFRCARTI